jgi:hypothetical protein
MTPELGIKANYTPILTSVNQNFVNFPLGMGFDPITLATSSQLLDVPAPTSIPMGTVNHYGPTLESITTQSDYTSVIDAEAKIVAKSSTGLMNGSASATYAETLNISSSSIALLSNYFQITGSYTMDTSSSPPANTWAPSNEAVANLLAAIDNAGGYMNFIQTYGSNFVGGYIYGVTFFGSYVAYFESFDDAIKANAALSGSYSGAVSGEINAELDVMMTAQSGCQSTKATSGGVYSPTTAVTSVETLNDAINAVVTATVNPVALYAITYDWRAINAVGSKYANDFNADNFQNNLATLQPIQAMANYAMETVSSLSSYANDKSINPIGPTSIATVDSLGTTVSNLQGQIEALTYTDLEVAPSPVPATLTQLQDDVEAANLQALNISNGQANFTITVILGSDGRWCPSSMLTSSAGVDITRTPNGATATCYLIQPSGCQAPETVAPPAFYVKALRTPQKNWDPDAGNNETWLFGLSYYEADLSTNPGTATLVVSIGMIQEDPYEYTKWVASVDKQPWTINGVTVWPTTVPCSIEVTLV